MNEFEKFLLWEAKSRDTIDFKKVYVDIADDLIAGLLLSQVIYWYLPDKEGKSKLRVEKKGHFWIAKGRDDWHSEIRISAKQFDRASSILVKKGILIKDYFMFGAFRTVHIRMDHERFMELWQEQIESGYIHQRVRPVLTNREDRSLLIGKTGVDQELRPITESTSESTSNMPQSGADVPEIPQVVEMTKPEVVSVGCTCASVFHSGGELPCKFCKANQTPVSDQTPVSQTPVDVFSDIIGNQPILGDQPPQPNSKPIAKTSEADKARLLTFGALPGNEPQAYDTIQEIKQAGWEIRDGTVEVGIAHFIEAVRAKRGAFAIPNNTSIRKDYYKSVAGHLQDYRLDQLPGLYSAVIDIRDKAGHSFSRPGALTKTLSDVANEPTTGATGAKLTTAQQERLEELRSTNG